MPMPAFGRKIVSVKIANNRRWIWHWSFSPLGVLQFANPIHTRGFMGCAHVPEIFWVNENTSESYVDEARRLLGAQPC